MGAGPTGYTPCELQERAFLGALRLCKSEICARGAICTRLLVSKLTDSLRSDYVAFGSTGRAKVQIIAVHKQKRDNREGYLSFVGGPSRTRT